MEFDSKSDVSVMTYAHELHSQNSPILPRSVSLDQEEQTAPKSVSFAFEAELYFIPHHSELSKQEYDATYMTSEDYQRIHKENIETIQCMLRQDFPCNDNLFFRGLEFSLPKSMNDRKQRIKFVVVHTLEEQFRNRVLNEEWIEAMRFHYTSKSAEFSHMMGVWDYEAMRECIIHDAKMVIQPKSASK